LVAGLGLVALCVVWYIKVAPPNQLNLRESANKHVASEDPDTVHLSTLAAPDDLRRNLLDGEFKIVFRMQDISEDCNAIFDSSFLTNSKAIPKRGEIRFADPGQPAQYGDSLTPDAPFRQLVFAGQGAKTCFVYYQHGGFQHPPLYCLAVMDTTDRKTIWVGEARKGARNLIELRALLAGKQFQDIAGPLC
jgi:hypothetical protein